MLCKENNRWFSLPRLLIYETHHSSLYTQLSWDALLPLLVCYSSHVTPYAQRTGWFHLCFISLLSPSSLLSYYVFRFPSERHSPTVRIDPTASLWCLVEMRIVAHFFSWVINRSNDSRMKMSKEAQDNPIVLFFLIFVWSQENWRNVTENISMHIYSFALNWYMHLKLYTENRFDSFPLWY